MLFKIIVMIALLLGPIKPAQALDKFGVKAMAFYSSQQLFRGAVVWPKPNVFAAPMLIFYEKVFVAGPNIYFSPTQRVDFFQWRLGTQFIDDNRPPLSLGDHEEDFRNQRKSSIETYFRGSFHFGKRGKFKLGTLLAREWKEGNGLHSEFFIGSPFLPFTSLEARVSFSEKAMSQYIHGRSAVSGHGFTSLGINGVMPFVPWDGVILLNFTQFWIAKQVNREADFIRGDSKKSLFSIRIIWNAL